MDAEKALHFVNELARNPHRDSQDDKDEQEAVEFLTDYINKHRMKSVKTHGIPTESGFYVVYWKQKCDVHYNVELAFFDERSHIFYRQPFNSSFINKMVDFYYKVSTVPE